MRYFDAIANAAFKVDSQGRTAFFPWGIFGRGYVLRSEPEAQKLRRHLKTYNLIALPLTFVAVFVLRLYALALIPPLYVTWWIWVRRRFAKHELSEQRLTWRDTATTQAYNLSWPMLLVLLIVSLTFTLGGLSILSQQPDQWMLGLSVVILFGFVTMGYVSIGLLKRRSRHPRT